MGSVWKPAISGSIELPSYLNFFETGEENTFVLTPVRTVRLFMSILSLKNGRYRETRLTSVNRLLNTLPWLRR